MNVEGISFLTLNLRNDFDLLGTLEAVSRLGLKVDLLPTGPNAEPVPGDSVSLAHMPKGLRAIIGGQQGRVVWTKGSRCGIAFDTPIQCQNEELETRLRDNHLLPWSLWS